MHRVAFIEILYNIIGHQTAERAEKKSIKKGADFVFLATTELPWPYLAFKSTASNNIMKNKGKRCRVHLGPCILYLKVQLF